MFKLQSPSKYSPFDAIHLLRLFSTAPNSFWTCQFWYLLVLLPFFVSPLLCRQNIFLWGLFHWGNKQKGCLGWDWVNRKGGAQGFTLFLVKNCWILGSGASKSIRKSPIMKGADALSLPKKFTEAERSLSQQHQLVHWSRRVPRTLT